MILTRWSSFFYELEGLNQQQDADIWAKIRAALVQNPEFKKAATRLEAFWGRDYSARRWWYNPANWAK